MKKTFSIFTLLLVSLILFDVSAQKRSRPNSMRHSEQDVINFNKTTPTTCTYISNGHTFSGDVYATGMAGRIKIGTSTLSLRGGRYTLTFKGSNFQMRDVLPPQEKGRFNPWRSEQLSNDFTQKGKYETFTKGSLLFLRLYDGDSADYITDIPLANKGVKYFELDEDGLLFEFSLN